MQAPTEEPQKQQPVEATGSSIRITPKRMVLQPATLDAKVELAGIAVRAPSLESISWTLDPRG